MNTRLAVKRAVSGAMRLLPRARPRRVVLSYHAVNSGPWSTPLGHFREQMAWLASRACIVPLEEMLHAPARADDLQVALTFDDGYRSVLTQGAPVIEDVNGAATLFVSTSQMRADTRAVSDPKRGYYPDEDFLLWDELRELRARGWSIASHGVEHPDLTRQTLDACREQFEQSRAALESHLDAPCRGFAYPYGRSSAAVRALVPQSGYRWAVCSTHGIVTDSADRFAVPRIDIRRDYQLSDFASIVTGDWDYLGAVQRVRHAVGFFS